MQFNRPSRGHKSTDSAINGIARYVQNRSYQVIPKIKDGNQFGSKLHKLMREFLKENNLDCKDNGSYKSAWYNSNVIQNNFELFKNWIEINYSS
jgi:hypothetical protein